MYKGYNIWWVQHVRGSEGRPSNRAPGGGAGGGGRRGGGEEEKRRKEEEERWGP